MGVGWVEARGSPVSSDALSLVGMICTVRDTQSWWSRTVQQGTKELVERTIPLLQKCPQDAEVDRTVPPLENLHWRTCDLLLQLRKHTSSPPVVAQQAYLQCIM